MMRTDIIAHQMNRPDVLSHLPVQVFEEGDAFLLPFAFITLAIDPARTGIKGGKEVEGASTFVLVLIPVGPVLRLRWPGRGVAFVILLSTMMLPAQVTMIPQFILLSDLKVTNTFWSIDQPKLVMKKPVVVVKSSS